ncbi:MAG: hypothetical protein Q9196_005646 [Gyalolechia fulgens]
MPFTPEDQVRVDEAEREARAAGSAKLLSKDTSESQKLGPFSVACTVWNRAIGNTALLEHIYDSPQFRTTCIYGFIFIVFGNLCGNAIALGMYVLQAADMDVDAPLSRGIAVVALTAACVLHAGWRRGGIVVNNVLAVIKIGILLAIIGIGFAYAAGASFGNNSGEKAPVITAKETNFNVHKSFSNVQGDFASYANAIMFTIYSFGGFKQPFYVMSEVSQPKKKFAKSVSAAMMVIVVLFMLVNVAYLCVVTNDGDLDAELDMATTFFRKVFGNETAPRIMSGIIALSIFGNIVIMTFTASRGADRFYVKVKQEIAKEGVLPFSRFFAMSVSTPVVWTMRKLRPSKASSNDAWLEQSPAPALFLHWLFTMLLMAATSSLAPGVAYQVLVSVYLYTVVLMVGLFVAGGLLYLRWCRGKEWTDQSGFRPWGGPTAAIVYSEVRRGYSWYVVPTVGISSAVVGYVYYLVFAKVIPRLREQVLVVERDPLIVRQGGKPDGEWVQILETIDFWWSARDPHSKV